MTRLPVSVPVDRVKPDPPPPPQRLGVWVNGIRVINNDKSLEAALGTPEQREVGAECIGPGCRCEFEENVHGNPFFPGDSGQATRKELVQEINNQKKIAAYWHHAYLNRKEKVTTKPKPKKMYAPIDAVIDVKFSEDMLLVLEFIRDVASFLGENSKVAIDFVERRLDTEDNQE